MRPYHYILTATATGLLVFAAFLTWQRWTVSTTGETIPPAAVVTVSTETPSEAKPPAPDQDSTYTVPDDHPRTMSIPAISSLSYVQPVGIDQHNAIAVPSNIHFSGWYNGSALPSTPGLSIIVGHVDGHYNDGVFHDLYKLKNGNDIIIEKGNRQKVSYKITSVTRINVDDTTSLFNKKGQSESELHLITCIGTYVPSKRSFDQRLLVIAEQVK